MNEELAIGSAIVLGLITGVSPLGAAEATALAAGALPSVPHRAAVIVVFTAAHVAAKMAWYGLGRLESRVTRPSLRARIDRAHAFAAAHPVGSLGVTFASATVSMPPFHLFTLAAGIVRAPFVPLLVVAFLGRLIRFSVIAAFPLLWIG